MKNSDLIFYGIAVLGFVLIFGSIFMWNNLTTKSLAMEIRAFDIIALGFAIVFADVICYEVYFRKKIPHKLEKTKHI